MSTIKTSVILEAGPNTDIWKKPPTTNIWTAPISHTSSGLLKDFQSARVTFWADWQERYDQGGLLLVPKRRSAAHVSPPERWIKTGVEYYLGEPQLSTVSTDRFADWSVARLTLGENERAPAEAGGVTVEIAREADEHGKSLWVYRLVLDASGAVAERIPLREICWVLADEDEAGGEEWLLDVSPLVARPEKNATDSLKVDFKTFEVQWRS
ncbi:uncharacterized protein F4812DRAFT_329957 [Daldinia caldariorum]|uniref:uncharacterized protein n=1 Tax=Daldinia caldariorum TaxID=326644 RepID=UPI002008337A|nr:uncharacterized protein F4812DRAFT_329957 [Daldinia caldariorum]KAI1469460.1 hypothetical protein F4812DRAFT_329957 [Daldinia caldariorum]